MLYVRLRNLLYVVCCMLLRNLSRTLDQHPTPLLAADLTCCSAFKCQAASACVYTFVWHSQEVAQSVQIPIRSAGSGIQTQGYTDCLSASKGCLQALDTPSWMDCFSSKCCGENLTSALLLQPGPVHTHSCLLRAAVFFLSFFLGFKGIRVL